jgi:hypothetical protein
VLKVSPRREMTGCSFPRRLAARRPTAEVST